MSETFVYFAQMPGSALVKIGKAKNPAARVASFATANPRRPALLGSIRETPFLSEREIHKRFDLCRVGGEWFVLFPDLRVFLDEFSIEYDWTPEIEKGFVVDFVSSLSMDRLVRYVANAEAMLADLKADDIGYPSPS